jgi:hypothetical protein
MLRVTLASKQSVTVRTLVLLAPFGCCTSGDGQEPPAHRGTQIPRRANWMLHSSTKIFSELAT